MAAHQAPPSLGFSGENTGVGCHFLLQCMKVKIENEVAQSCPTLSGPMACSLPGSSIHGIFQARVLEWGAIAFSGRGGEEYINRMYWVAQKVHLGFSSHCMEKPKWTFWQTQYFKQEKDKSLLPFFFLIKINFWLGWYFQRKLVWNSGNFSVNQTYKIVYYLGNIILLWYWGRAHRQ